MENERALRSLLAVVEAKVNDAEATLADLHNRQRVLEQMLAEEIGHAPASAPDTPHITIKEGGLCSNNIQSGDMTVRISKPLLPPWKFLGKTELVKRVLSEADQPLGPTEIAERLEAAGLRQENTEAVRGALAWMKRKGTAKALARSQWVLVGGRVDQRLSPEEPGDETFPLDAERPLATVSPVRGEESPGGADADQVGVGG